MPLLHDPARDAAAPRPHRRRRLKSIAVLPSMFTLGNLLCGFAAIHFATRTEANLIAAAYLLIAAGICDALDGRIARMTRKTSDFGGQLDSLADIVSFGVAPAIMIIALFSHTIEAPQHVSPISDKFLGRTAWIMCAVYVACAALRLARFNVENKHDESAHLGFKGLPSPAAAGMVTVLILLNEEILRRAEIRDAVSVVADSLTLAMPLIALLLGLLMVSRIPYVHLTNVLFRGRRPFWQVVLMVVLISGAWVYPQLVLVLIGCAYTLSGLVRYFFHKVFRHPEKISDGLTPGRQTNSELSSENVRHTA